MFNIRVPLRYIMRIYYYTYSQYTQILRHNIIKFKYINNDFIICFTDMCQGGGRVGENVIIDDT